jgi:uncharacterized membrane protein
MKCGANLAAPQQAQPPQQPQQQPWGQPQYPAQPPQYPQPPASSNTGGLEENLACALCYALGWLSGVFFLVVDPLNKTIRFHAVQSILFNVGTIVLWIAWGIVTGIIRAMLPFSLGFVFAPLSGLLGLAFLGAWLFLMYKAYNREHFKIPVLGDIAEKHA